MTQGTGACNGGYDTASSPATRPHDTTSKGHDTASLCTGASGTRVAWPQWVTIQFLYREGEGGLVSRHSTRHGLRYGVVAPCDTTACARDTANAHCDTACDTAGYNHDTALMRATTRPSAICHTALGAWPRRSARATCAQPGPWVCSLCTRPSFDSVHCSESLFMNTVHEVFKIKYIFFLLNMI